MSRLLARLRRRRFTVDRHYVGPLDPAGHRPSECEPEWCGARPGDWLARLRP